MLRLSRLLSGGFLFVALGVTLLNLVGFPLGSAPFQLAPIGPAGEPVRIEIAYGTEKRAWLEDAVTRFAATNPRVRGRPIEIVLKGIGSREMVTDIVQNEYQPTVVSPASMIQIELLRDQWARKTNGGQIIPATASAAQPLVLTPLVVVAWEERASVLWQNDPANFWQDIHRVTAAQQGWAEFGKPEWGFVNFGHTSPETSNSGLQTLLLLAYGYHNKARDLTSADITSPEFQQWLTEVERAVPQFGESTGLLMEDMLRFGPSKYDFIAVYESLAIENFQIAEGRGGRIRVFYPPANIYSEHPYAILNAPWVSADQRDAATQFRDFLLSSEIQEIALKQYGFRPANLQVAIDPNDQTNPFVRYANYGITYDIAEQVAVPPADVLNTLIELWRRQIKR
jgi:ABC-type Fe3+ transport system substrate-binding protein